MAKDFTYHDPNFLSKDKLYTLLDENVEALHVHIPKPINKTMALDYEYKNAYAITLTQATESVSDLQNNVDKIIRSKMFGIQDYIYCWELTKNNMPHIHMMVKTNSYVDASKVLLLNGHDRVDVKKLKTKIDILKWINYILKKKSSHEYQYFNDQGVPELIVKHAQ